MADLRQVLADADAATARLIVELQLEDATAISSAAAGDAEDATESDARFAFKLMQDELNDIRNGLPPKPPSPPPAKRVRCSACTDTYTEQHVLTAPCEDHYCRGCLAYLFRSSLTDETLYPPRCCTQPIPVEDARAFLPHDLVSEFIDRCEELETQDRTYCYRPQCSAFIPPSAINNNTKIAECPKCRYSTCAECKNQVHLGDCTGNESHKQLLALAEEKKWKQCSACHRMIELNTGCNHMTCRCTHEFCYVCGREWKNCDCDTWDEARLLARGQRIVQDLPAGVGNRDVQRAVDHVREHHDCRHNRGFDRARGVGREFECEMCGRDYSEWIPRCRICFMLMCVRCKNNRRRA